jgi:hypothetical protein
MPTFEQAAVQTLIWYRPERIKEHFELRRDQREQTLVGTLKFDPRPAFAWEYMARHPAAAETSDGTWRLTVVRRGFLGLKADLHVEGSNSGVLEASYFLRKGTLTLSDTPDHRWVGSVMRNGSDVFENSLGFPVLRLDRGDYFERVNARVAIFPGTPPSLVSCLACVGFYMRLLMNKGYR